MNNTIIPKINNIKIAVLKGARSLDVNYNYQEFNKVGVSENEKNVSGVVPLGKASATLSFVFYPYDINDNNELYSIVIENEGKEIKIDDEYLGTLYGYILTANYSQSHEDVNKPLYKVKINIVSGEWVATLNYKASVEGLAELEKSNLLQDIYKIKGAIERAGNPIAEALKEDILDPLSDYSIAIKSLVLSGSRAFVDSTFNAMFSALTTLSTSASIPKDVLTKTSNAISQIDSLFDSFKEIKKEPENFYKLLLNIIDSSVDKANENKIQEIYKIKEIENYNELGGIAKKKYETENKINILLNRTAVVMDINKLLLGGFKKRSDLIKLSKDIINRYDYLGYQEDIAFDYKNIIKKYYLSINLSNLEPIKIEIAQPLLRIVYDKYGNLDYYEDIININNIKDVENVEGDLLLYKL